MWAEHDEMLELGNEEGRQDLEDEVINYPVLGILGRILLVLELFVIPRPHQSQPTRDGLRKLIQTRWPQKILGRCVWKKVEGMGDSKL